MGHLVLVTGGARSGKSAYAERRLVELSPAGERIYFATAEPFDDEMRERVRLHRERRGDGWRTVEAPRELVRALKRELVDAAALVDCITIWLSNLLLDGSSDGALVVAAYEVAEAARARQGPVVLVTNEVGAGIVPENALARRFRDAAGLVNQALAAQADEVTAIICGLPLRLR